MSTPVRTLERRLVDWLPPLVIGERGEYGDQYLIAGGDPDLIVAPASEGCLQVRTSVRGVEQESPISARFDIMQRWIAWSMAPGGEPERARRSLDERLAVPAVPDLVPVPDSPLTTAVEDERHTVLLDSGVVVARLLDPSGMGDRSQGRLVNRLSHYAYIPLPVLLDQLSRPAGGPGSVFSRGTDEWGNLLRPSLESQQSEAARLRAAVRTLTGL
jgi:hypothetical protein